MLPCPLIFSTYPPATLTSCMGMGPGNKAHTYSCIDTPPLMLMVYVSQFLMFVHVQGSATVGVKSKMHVVLVALKRSTSELSSYQKKIFPIDDHVAVSIAGLTSDGRMLR